MYFRASGNNIGVLHAEVKKPKRERFGIRRCSVEMAPLPKFSRSGVGLFVKDINHEDVFEEVEEDAPNLFDGFVKELEGGRFPFPYMRVFCGIRVTLFVG